MNTQNLKLLFLFFFVITNSFCQIGIGNTDPKATLDITATNATGTATTVDGIIIPRVTRERAQSMTSVTTSTMIYINEVATGSATGTTANVTSVGFYFYNGSTWEKIATGATTDWSLTGNSGTTAGTNFIGTTGTDDIRIKTNSTDRWNISHANSGQLQSYSLGTAALPIYSFQGDQNTGIWSSGTDVLNFSTNGTERVRIDNTGKVGVGSTNPTSKLKIDASTDTFPSLEIVPRTTAPTGTTSGQIAMIDNSIYIYDATRAKWLSSETMTYTFGGSGALDGVYLGYGGVANANSGAKILQNATIIGITAEAASGNNSKAIDIELASGITTFNLNGALAYSSNTTSIDVNAADYIAIFAQAAGASVSNLTVTLHLKWRK